MSQFSIFENSVKKNLHYFRKRLFRRCLTGLWICLRSWIYQGSEYVMVPNMPWFWIYKGSEYSRVLNMQGFWIYQGYTGFCMCLNIPRWFLNMPDYVWICQNVEHFIAHGWQGCEYASNPEYTRDLNMALVLNIPGFWICQDSEYARVLDIPEFWKCQSSEYVKFLNMPGFWIYQGSEYASVLNIGSE